MIGMPLETKIDFSIDLVLGIVPSYNAPYWMSTPELKELQMQLEEILKKGYIRPNVSHWGASMLFLKKKYGTLILYVLQTIEKRNNKKEVSFSND